MKKCYRCSSQYSSSKHGACIICYPRDQCSNPKCTELAYYDEKLGSYNYCSRECRDEFVLKGANENQQRGLKKYVAVPGKKTSNRSPGRKSSCKRVSSVGAKFSTKQVTVINTATRQSTPHSTSSTGSNPSTPHMTSSTWRSTGSNQSSPHTTSNMSVGSASQPTTSTRTTMSQSDTKSTIPTNPPIGTSHQQSSQTVTSQPQSFDQSMYANQFTCI